MECYDYVPILQVWSRLLPLTKKGSIMECYVSMCQYCKFGVDCCHWPKKGSIMECYAPTCMCQYCKSRVDCCHWLKMIDNGMLCLCTNTTSLESLSVTYDRSMVFSANTTDRHDIPEIVLKVKHHKPNLQVWSRLLPLTKEDRYGMLCLYVPILLVYSRLLPLIKEER